MMKKKIVYPVGIVLAFLQIGVCALFLKPEKFHTKERKDCSVSYLSGNTLMTKRLDPADEKTILNMLDGCRMYRDNLSCGFGKEASLRFGSNDTELYFSQDTCGFVYSVQDEKYLSLSDADKTVLFDILGNYGLTFPCLS